MDNWFANKEEIKQKTIKNVMRELESLLEIRDDKTESANYWIDSAHNVYAFINDNGDDDEWIEIHYELYDSSADIIGDLAVLNSEDVTKKSLLREIKTIVDMYFND